MKRRDLSVPRLALALGGALSLGAAAPEDDCAALSRLPIAGVAITEAVRVPLTEGGACRVIGIASPVAGSRIGFEVWLPDAARWNGRYYQLGNGGFAGNIDRPALEAEAERGNAAAATDTGHIADRFDASWAAGNPVAVEDYGHRSIKATSDAAAALIHLFYGRAARRRYFAGCSNGGRQALMAAQRYPDDWDGILAGAPANPWTGQLAAFIRLQYRLRETPGTWLPPARLAMIERAALASCPAGARDGGVATDPARCRLDIGRLLCRPRRGPDCLTPAQARSLRLIIAAGFQPSSAADENGWRQWIVNPDPGAPSQLRFAVQARRHLFGGASAPSPGLREILDADGTGLDRFRTRGGRILSYFGWGDALISPGEGLAYYRRVAAENGGLASTRSFYRLFMIPGMGHCQGGDGEDSFGQSMISPPLHADARHDIRIALEQWVERGIAPSEIVAARYRGAGTGAEPRSTRSLRAE